MMNATGIVSKAVFMVVKPQDYFSSHIVLLHCFDAVIGIILVELLYAQFYQFPTTVKMDDGERYNGNGVKNVEDQSGAEEQEKGDAEENEGSNIKLFMFLSTLAVMFS